MNIESICRRKGYLELAIKRLLVSGPLSNEEEDSVRTLASLRRNVSKECLLLEPDGDGIHFVLDGWACRQRNLADGRRQIFDIVLPGDIVGHLPDEAGARNYSWIALSNVVLVDAGPLLDACRQWPSLHPGIIAALRAFKIRCHDRLLDHVVRLGARMAYERVGHLLLEIFERQSEVGLTSGTRMPFLIGQERLGQILGLSEVHVNRTMTRLREDGLLLAGPGWVELPQIENLARSVEYQTASSMREEAWLANSQGGGPMSV